MSSGIEFIIIFAGPKTYWPQNKKKFAFDTSKYSALRFVLIIEKGMYLNCYSIHNCKFGQLNMTY